MSPGFKVNLGNIARLCHWKKKKKRNGKSERVEKLEYSEYYIH